MTKEEVDALLEEFDKATPGPLRRSVVAKMFRDRRDLLAACEAARPKIAAGAQAQKILNQTLGVNRTTLIDLIAQIDAAINAAKESP